MATPVYMVAMIDVKDYETYAEQYGMPVGRMFAEVGAEILVATTQPDVLEGSWPGNWTVVVKVPSAEIARALYAGITSGADRSRCPPRPARSSPRPSAVRSARPSLRRSASHASQ
jgi:uncharacterized protein (DUF1330 family)